MEHVSQKKISKTLNGIYKVLKNKGKFYVSVPDMDILCKTFIHSKTTMELKFHTMRIMFGGQLDEFDFHYFGWNFQFLNNFLLEAGFKKIEKVDNFSIFKDTSNYMSNGAPISLNVIAYK